MPPFGCLIPAFDKCWKAIPTLAFLRTRPVPTCEPNWNEVGRLVVSLLTVLDSTYAPKPPSTYAYVPSERHTGVMLTSKRRVGPVRSGTRHTPAPSCRCCGHHQARPSTFSGRR